MKIGYAVAPLAAWIAAGGLKFLVNSIRARRPAFDLIGYGGFPSNHAAIASSVAWLIGFREGIAHPAFGVAVAFLFIVCLDAGGLRRHVGRQARAINRLSGENSVRERMGHAPHELGAGILVGGLVARLFLPLT